MPHWGVNSFIPRTKWLTSFWEGHLVPFMVWILFCGTGNEIEKLLFGYVITQRCLCQIWTVPRVAALRLHVLSAHGESSGVTEVYLVYPAVTLYSFQEHVCCKVVLSISCSHSCRISLSSCSSFEQEFKNFVGAL